MYVPEDAPSDVRNIAIGASAPAVPPFPFHFALINHQAGQSTDVRPVGRPLGRSFGELVSSMTNLNKGPIRNEYWGTLCPCLPHLQRLPSSDTLYRFLRPASKYINKYTGTAFMFFVSMSHYCRCSFASHVLQGMLSLGHNMSVPSTSGTVAKCRPTQVIGSSGQQTHTLTHILE